MLSPAARDILRGILLLARFRAEGMALFPATPQAFLNSLAPILGLTLVQAVPDALTGELRRAVMRILVSLVLLLAPAVLSHAVARLAHRRGLLTPSEGESLWLRYMVALNWCQAVFSLAMIMAGLLFGGVSANPMTAGLPMLALSIYWLALYWFMTRIGLQLSAWRAAFAVLVISLATGVLVLGPEMIGMAVAGNP